MDSPSATSTFHLALATVFGASVMAVSAFYLHKRSLDQVLHRLTCLRRPPGAAAARRRSSLVSDGGGEDEPDEARFRSTYDGEIDDDRGAWRRGGVSKSLNENMMNSYRVSSSMPNVALSRDWFNENADADVALDSLDNLDLIPSGLPPLRTDQRAGENEFDKNSSSKTRVGSVGRLVTPRSSGGYAFESAEDSDEEGRELAIEEDTLYTYENFNCSAEHGPTSYIPNPYVVPSKAEIVNSVQIQECGTIPNEGLADVNKKCLLPSFFSPNFLYSESMSIEEEEVRKMIRECLALREKYVFQEKVAPWKKVHEGETNASIVNGDPSCVVPVETTAQYSFRMEDGVVHVYASENDTVDLFPVASSTTFFTDMHHLLRIMSIGNVRSACHHRLRFLEEKFRLHLLVNADREFLAQKAAPHRDFYNIRKVDTHVHHSACMNQKHLLRFIKSKLRKEPDEVVIFRDGQYLTLKEVFESLDLNGYDLNVDLLDVHADKSTFHRFDKFNLKYNPCGQSRLREIFLKQDNLIQGRYLGEVTKEVLSDLEASKYQMAEYRVSIYGRKQSEWDQLASWFINNSIDSENAVWLIQLPRLYNVYKSMGTVTSFQNILDNVFIPLFEVTIDPKSHPQLHVFLMQVVGLDIVDDESKPERRPTKHMPKPSEWTNEFNPAYSYYAYYCYANLYTLNKLRESKGMPTIRFRPHCGEAGDIDHLAAGFLLCHNISHGINLRKSPVLQYLYYLAQIGLAMSPLSNNSLFLDYHRNPFPMFFQRGLNVSLSSDDPLQIHLTKEALVEEYSVAAKVWKLSSCDLCEIARNSVYQSGFSHVAKSHWLGGNYFKKGPEGNDIHKTNVPRLRIFFRHETWKEEMQYVFSGRARLAEDVDY
ncbi:hypothetical protein RJ640_012688 [Escallonia rubra]|uniref:AMP deaminase n=1 Tax=Escallonia rubra TaxID=112253 RepID=A0AA88RKA5_9ASTE|nr:hypothetical protein RJ640_012688 [Escallonia rubra]